MKTRKKHVSSFFHVLPHVDFNVAKFPLQCLLYCSSHSSVKFRWSQDCKDGQNCCQCVQISHGGKEGQDTQLQRFAGPRSFQAGRWLPQGIGLAHAFWVGGDLEEHVVHGVQGQFDASWRQVCTLSRYSVSTTKRLSSGSYQPWSKQETSEEGFCCEVTFFWCGINLLSWRWKDLHKNWVEIHNSCPGACGVHLPTWFLFSKSNLFFDFSCYFQRVSSLWCGLNCIIFDSTRRIESTNTSTLFVK